jgi:hypothetical protein
VKPEQWQHVKEVLDDALRLDADHRGKRGELESESATSKSELPSRSPAATPPSASAPPVIKERRNIFRK